MINSVHYSQRERETYLEQLCSVTILQYDKNCKNIHPTNKFGKRRKILYLDSPSENVNDVEVNIVWDPPWTPDRMSEQARQRAGLR